MGIINGIFKAYDNIQREDPCVVPGSDGFVDVMSPVIAAGECSPARIQGIQQIGWQCWHSPPAQELAAHGNSHPAGVILPRWPPRVKHLFASAMISVPQRVALAAWIRRSHCLPDASVRASDIETFAHLPQPTRSDACPPLAGSHVQTFERSDVHTFRRPHVHTFSLDFARSGG